MIRILIGDNSQAILNRIQNIESEYEKVTRIDCKKEGVDKIFESLVSEGLFSEKRLVIFQNADSLGVKKEKEVEQFLDKQKSNICDVVVLSDGTKKTPIFSNLKPIMESYMLPKFYFAFLDSLVPGNAKIALDLFSKIPDDVDRQQLFYSVVKRVWQLTALVSTQDPSRLAFLGMSPWQIGKVRTQAAKWDQVRLLHFYNSLFTIEKDLKSSNLALPISGRLDILLSSELN